MNCRYAREIINLAIDGERHPLEAEARQHICECEACQGWQAGMDSALGLLAAAGPPPMPDISALVMSKLPERHPASIPKAVPSVQLLSWFGFAWLLGVMLVAGLFMTLLPTLNVGGLGRLISALPAVLSPIKDAIVIGRSIGHGALMIAQGIGIGKILTVPLLLDLGLVTIALLIWHRRRLITASHACLI